MVTNFQLNRFCTASFACNASSLVHDAINSDEAAMAIKMRFMTIDLSQ